MIDASALLFLQALDRGGLAHERRHAASDVIGARASGTRQSSLDDRVAWLAAGSLPWERP